MGILTDRIMSTRSLSDPHKKSDTPDTSSSRTKSNKPIFHYNILEIKNIMVQITETIFKMG